jgi:3-oxoadipate enol-lactonase
VAGAGRGRHALEVQLAAPEEFAPVEVAVDLPAITAPSLVVAGAKDLPDFGQIAAELAGLLPAGRLVELAWAGHLPTLERPQELSAMLVAFLREAGWARR